MTKTVPQLPGIPPSDYPFSQVVEANGFVFLAGQVGDAPGGHGAVPGGIEAETRAMLDNVGRLLTAVGLGFENVVKATVYLRDFSEFATMNAVYREYFPTEPPTRATVGVTALAADYRIEIEVLAARGRGPPGTPLWDYFVTTKSSIATIAWPFVPTTTIVS